MGTLFEFLGKNTAPLLTDIARGFNSRYLFRSSPLLLHEIRFLQENLAIILERVSVMGDGSKIDKPPKT